MRFFWLSLFLLFFLQVLGSTSYQAHKVAVIGSGIGGSAFTHFASDSQLDYEVEVFERSDRVGGRVKHFDFDGQSLEIGASILYSGNRYVLEMARSAGLVTREPLHSEGHMGIWNGERFVFEASASKIWTLLKFLWSFGLFEFRALHSVVYDTLDKFRHVYGIQSVQKQAFKDSKELWKALDLYSLTQQSTHAFLSEKIRPTKTGKITKGDASPPSLASRPLPILDQLVYGVNKVNYNQNNHQLNALAGVVSLCPLVTGDLVQVEGGNAQICERVLASKAARLHTSMAVQRVLVHEESEEYFLEVSVQGGGMERRGPFEAVVLATPFRTGEEEIPVFLVSGEEETRLAPSAPLAGHFQSCVSTFVCGKLRTPGLLYEHPVSDMVSTVLVGGLEARSGREEPFFSSISEHLGPDRTSHALCERVAKEQGFFDQRAPQWDLQTDSPLSVFKVFSTDKPTPEQLDSVFRPYAVLSQEPWLAYPAFQPPEANLPSFQPYREAPQLYFVNAIERGVAAMEISAIGAKNVQLLLDQALATPSKQRDSTDEL